MHPTNQIVCIGAIKHLFLFIPSLKTGHPPAQNRNRYKSLSSTINRFEAVEILCSTQIKQSPKFTAKRANGGLPQNQTPTTEGYSPGTPLVSWFTSWAVTALFHPASGKTPRFEPHFLSLTHWTVAIIEKWYNKWSLKIINEFRGGVWRIEWKERSCNYLFYLGGNMYKRVCMRERCSFSRPMRVFKCGKNHSHMKQLRVFFFIANHHMLTWVA